MNLFVEYKLLVDNNRIPLRWSVPSAEWFVLVCQFSLAVVSVVHVAPTSIGRGIVKCWAVSVCLSNALT